MSLLFATFLGAVMLCVLEKKPYGRKGLFWMMASDAIVHHGGKGAALGEMEQ